MVATPPSPSASEAHRISQQKAVLTLIVASDGTMEDYEAVVTRITPESIRVALHDPIHEDPRDIYRWNPRVRLVLRLPAPLPAATTACCITGMAMNFDPDLPPTVFDLAFPALSETEEKALRDSNRALVVA